MFNLFNDIYFRNFVLMVILSGIFLMCFVFYLKQFGTWIWPIGEALKGFFAGYCAMKACNFGIIAFLLVAFLDFFGCFSYLVVICISGTPLILFIGMMLIVDKSINPDRKIPWRSIVTGISMVLLYFYIKEVVIEYWDFVELLSWEYFKEVLAPVLVRRVLPWILAFYTFICANLWYFFYRYYKHFEKLKYWIPVSLLCTVTLTGVAGIVFFKINISTKDYVFERRGIILSKANK